MSDDVRRVCGAKDQPIGGYDSIWDAVDGTHALMPWEDYERLRAEVDEAYQRSAMFAKRIEELSQIVRECEQSLAERDSRIEELERVNRFHTEGDKQDGLYVITADKIDAMWEMAVANGPEGLWVLEGGGIVQCEECDGSECLDPYEQQGKPTKERIERGDISCPTCHGHGWVIK